MSARAKFWASGVGGSGLEGSQVAAAPDGAAAPNSRKGSRYPCATQASVETAGR
jgi:hypothetical protein